MKKLSFILALLVFSNLCNAQAKDERHVTLIGEIENGVTLSLYHANILEGKASPDLFIIDSIVETGIQEHAYEISCVFVKKANKRSALSCAKKGDDPLSGASYRITPIAANGDVFYAKYKCVRGCENPKTPKILKESIWEP